MSEWRKVPENGKIEYDGDVILFTHRLRRNPERGWYHGLAYKSTSGGWTVGTSAAYLPLRPGRATHWMPYPELPKD